MSKQSQIRVVIVDDHAVVRGGLEYFLSTTPDIRVIGHADDGDRAVALCAQLQPDVVLMDLVMPRMNGVDTTKAIRHAYPKIQVIVLTSFQEEDLVQRALKAGAIGYLLKDVPAYELADAIRSASVGRSTLAPQITQVLINSLTQPRKLGYDLTEREREVLIYLVDGLTNAEIAERIIVSNNTVRHHVRSILAKLDVTNRTAAVRLAVQNQLVPKLSAH